MLASDFFVNPDNDSDFSDLLLVGSDVAVAGYGQDNEGIWTAGSGSQTVFSHPWGLAAGQSHIENPSIIDPAGDSASDWTSPSIDVDQSADDAIIALRSIS
jgi:hypothetical protein